MIQAVDFTEARWRDITLQPQQRRDHPDAMAVFDGPTWTFVDDDGHCIACGGLYEAAIGVPVAWAYIGRDAGPMMPALFVRPQDPARQPRPLGRDQVWCS